MLHHERWDGKGCPFGLAGERLPLERRIVAVADVFDALSGRRPYKKPRPEQKCLDILRQGAGSPFDPRVVEAFFSLIAQCSRSDLKTLPISGGVSPGTARIYFTLISRSVTDVQLV